MLNLLRDPVWQGIGVIATVMIGLLGFYLAGKQKIWLYITGIVTAVIIGSIIGAVLERIAAQEASVQLQQTLTAKDGEIEIQRSTVEELRSTMASLSSTAILTISTFDNDAEGWRIGGGGNGPEYKTEGGYSSGNILGREVVGENLADWYYVAPEEFLGDKSSAYNGILYFALFQADITEAITSTDDLVLLGENITLTYDFVNPSQEWTEYAVWLNPAAGWRKEDGTIPTEGEMRRVLSTLQELRIRGEFRTGDDYGGLDSVILNKHP